MTTVKSAGAATATVSPDNVFRGVTRLGEPFGNTICAYYGGVAHQMLLCMEEIVDEYTTRGLPEGVAPRKRLPGMNFRVLEKHETPPPKAVLLEGVEDAKKAGKFEPKVMDIDGVNTIQFSVSCSLVQKKRLRTTSGMVLHKIWRGADWRDRGGAVHHESC